MILHCKISFVIPKGDYWFSYLFLSKYCPICMGRKRSYSHQQTSYIPFFRSTNSVYSLQSIMNRWTNTPFFRSTNSVYSLQSIMNRWTNTPFFRLTNSVYSLESIMNRWTNTPFFRLTTSVNSLQSIINRWTNASFFSYQQLKIESIEVSHWLMSNNIFLTDENFLLPNDLWYTLS